MMNEITRNAEKFIGYEYKEVTTTNAMEDVYDICAKGNALLS